MPRYSEIMFHSEMLREYLDHHSPSKLIIKTKNPFTRIVIYSDEIQYNHIGINFPLLVTRRDRKTNEIIEVEGRVSVPMNCVVSAFEYESDNDPDVSKKAKIGFIVE